MGGKIFVVKTTAGREDLVAEFIGEEVKKKDARIYAVLIPPGIKGYVFVEADNIYEVQRAIYGIPHARGILPQEVSIEEIEHYLIPEKRVIEINKGDLVEIIAGPFKGSRAKVIRFDQQKEEVTVELVDSPIPIPLTLKIDDIKIVGKQEETETSKELEEEEKWEEWINL